MHFGLDRLMNVIDFQTKSGSVRYKVYPTCRLTRGRRGTTIRGITDFVSAYEFVDTDSYIFEKGQRFGSGPLTNRWLKLPLG